MRFGLGGDGSAAADGCVAIVTHSADNYLLPPAYLADLQTYTGLAHRRFVLGQWCGSEGLVYDSFDRQRMVRERSGPWSRVIVGVDWGYTNPSAVLLVCVDEQGALHVGEEFYRTGQLEPDVVRACQRFGSDAGAETFVVDPSAAALRATMERAGLCVVAGDNDVFGGITRVQKRLVVDGAGTPRLTVSPTCRHLIEELGVYEWMEGKDKPRKVHDHACDALRYAVMHLDEDRELEVRLLGGGGGGGSGGGNWTAPTRAWWDDRPRIWREMR